MLERTGIEVMPSECRELFRAAGAKIDDAANRVFISRQMVEWALKLAPSEVLLGGRDPRHNMLLGGTRVYLGTGGAAVKVLDLETGEARESTLADVAQFGRLADALDNIHFYLRACVARDIPVDLLDINTFYASITNTTKHVTVNAFSVQAVREIIELATLIAGSREALLARPLVSFTNCWTVSPLRYAPETVEVLTEIIRQGIPVFTSSAPQAGATSPAALAGTLVFGETFESQLEPGMARRLHIDTTGLRAAPSREVSCLFTDHRRAVTACISWQRPSPPLDTMPMRLICADTARLGRREGLTISVSSKTTCRRLQGPCC